MHGGGCVMDWVYIAASGTGAIIFINYVSHDGRRTMMIVVYRHIN